MKSTCKITGCDTRCHARGMCENHYKQELRRTGPKPKLTVKQRFFRQINRTETCWVWTGCRASNGYGRFFILGRKQIPAHVASFEFVNGAVPEGHEIDHMCHNRACVNPEHLRAVTRKQNVENHQGARRDNLSSGIRNVHRNGHKWSVRIHHNGKLYRAGEFTNLEDAEAAAIAARNALFTHNDIDRRVS